MDTIEIEGKKFLIAHDLSDEEKEALKKREELMRRLEYIKFLRYWGRMTRSVTGKYQRYEPVREGVYDGQ